MSFNPVQLVKIRESKGHFQVTVPSEIRHDLGFEEGDVLAPTTQAGMLVFVPVPDPHPDAGGGSR